MAMVDRKPSQSMVFVVATALALLVAMTIVADSTRRSPTTTFRAAIASARNCRCRPTHPQFRTRCHADVGRLASGLWSRPFPPRMKKRN